MNCQSIGRDLLFAGVITAGFAGVISAAAATFFTTLHPPAGAVFGAVYGVVSLVTLIGMQVICGPEFAAKNCLAALAINVVVSSAVTVGLTALLFTAIGVTFTVGSLFILLGGTIGIALAIALGFAACCAAKRAASTSSVSSST